MKFTRYILLPDGRLRAGWGLLLFVILYIVTGNLAGWLFAGWLGTYVLASSGFIHLTAAVVPTWLLMRFVDRRPLQSVGLFLDRRALREIGYGFGIGFVMVEFTIVSQVTARLVVIESVPSATGLEMGSMAGVFVILLITASAEEIIFRGYPFQRLVDGVGAAAAIAISSILFGLMHAGNPDATGLSVLNTVLAGIFFSLAYLKTRALWLPIGAHFAWNWTLAISGFPVSGLELAHMPWQAVAASETIWLHGGAYGPEGGIVCTVALAMGIAFVALKVNGPNSQAGKTSPE